MDLTMLLGPGDAASQTRRSDGKQAAGASGALFHGLLAGAITRDEREPVEAADGVAPLGLDGVDAEAPSDAQAPEAAPAVGATEDPESTEAAATGNAEKVPAGGGDVLTATLSATVTSVPPSPQFTLIPLPDPLSDAPLVQPALQGPPLGPSLNAPSVRPSLEPASGTVLPSGPARPGSATSEPASAEAALTRPVAQPAALDAAPNVSGDPAHAPTASALPATNRESRPASPSIAAGSASAQPDAAPAQRGGEAPLDAAAAPTATEGHAVESAAALVRDDSAARRLARQVPGRPSAAGERSALRSGAGTEATARTSAALPSVAISASEGPRASAQTPGEAQAEPAPAASPGDRMPRPAATSAPTLARETPTPVVALAGEPPASAASQELDAAPEIVESTPLPVRALPERTLRVLSELRADGETHYRAELELDPPALGRVHLEVEFDGEGRRSLTRFTVESHAAHEQLQAELPRLRALLAEQGLGDAQVELQLRQGGSQGQPQGEGQSRSWREGLRAERETPAVNNTWRSGHDGLIDLRA